MITRIGLVGYGPGGKNFHAPFIAAADGVELAAVVTRSVERRAEVAKLYGVPVFDSQAEMLDRGRDIDAVTISTPPETRRQLVVEALRTGRHVVADKPFAPSEPAGRELADLARELGLVLAVYYNRRWDADLLTLARAMAEGRLGSVWRIHNRFDLDEAGTVDPGPDGGLLRDLGIHLIDQMVWLLGPVDSVDAHLDLIETSQGPVDASFAVTLHHAGGAASYVSGTKLNGIHQREIRAYGNRGSFRATAADVADVTALGRRPADDPADPNFAAAGNWSALITDGVWQRYPSAAGDYSAFYTGFGAAVRGQGPAPVPIESALSSIAVLDAALISGSEGRRVSL